MRSSVHFVPACLLSFLIVSAAFAEPAMPKERIPPGVPEEVRKQMERLYSQEPTDRASAAFHLARMGEQALPSVPFLVANLHDSGSSHCGDVSCQDPTHQVSPADEAEKALLQFGKAAVEALIHAMRNEDLDIRRRATVILGKIKDARAVPALLTALDDENRNLRMAASFSLAEIGEPSFDGLTAVLSNKQKPFETRADAAWALGIIKNSGVVDLLIATLREGNADLSGQSSRALERITGKDLGSDPKAWEQWREQNKGGKS